MAASGSLCYSWGSIIQSRTHDTGASLSWRNDLDCSELDIRPGMPSTLQTTAPAPPSREPCGEEGLELWSRLPYYYFWQPLQLLGVRTSSLYRQLQGPSEASQRRTEQSIGSAFLSLNPQLDRYVSRLPFRSRIDRRRFRMPLPLVMLARRFLRTVLGLLNRKTACS